MPTMSIRMSEGVSVEPLDAHRLQLTSEMVGALDDASQLTLRPADRTRGEYGDYVLELRGQILDGADSDHVGLVWCSIECEWVPREEADAHGSARIAR